VAVARAARAASASGGTPSLADCANRANSGGFDGIVAGDALTAIGALDSVLSALICLQFYAPALGKNGLAKVRNDEFIIEKTDRLIG
jgi:hypothetical protein